LNHRMVICRVTFILCKKKVIGNKAYNLVRMTVGGFPVPPGFIIHRNETLADLQLRTLYDKFIKSGKASVRSSSSNEDGEKNSGAGFYKTILDLQFEEISPAIQAVRQQANTQETMPIIVQEYIKAKLSGVAFSIDPVHGTDNVYLEYNAGGCDSVVSGHITPKAKSFDKNNIQKDKLLPKELVQHIIHLEIFFGLPVDVEWCIDDQGKIWILQCRPITTIPRGCYQYAWSTREPLWAMHLAFNVRCNEIENRYSRIYSHKEIIYTRDKSGVFDCYIGLVDNISALKYVANKTNQEYVRPREIEVIKSIDSILRGKSILERYDFLSGLYCKLIRCYMRSEPIATDVLERYVALYLSSKDINILLSSGNDDLIFCEQYDFSNINQSDEKALLAHIKKYPYLSINCVKKDEVVSKLKKLKKSHGMRVNKKRHAAVVVPGSISKAVEHLKSLSSERMLVKNGWAGVYFYMMDLMEWISNTFNESQDDLYHYYLSDEIKRLITSGVTLTEDEKRTRQMGVIMKSVDGEAPFASVQFGDYLNMPAVEKTANANGWLLHGKATIKKKIKGEVKLVDYDAIDNDSVYLKKIVVTEMAQPNMVPIFRHSAGLITNEGGVLSHACIISREYNIPCIVGTKNATQILRDGDRVIMWPDGRITYDNE